MPAQVRSSGSIKGLLVICSAKTKRWQQSTFSLSHVPEIFSWTTGKSPIGPPADKLRARWLSKFCPLWGKSGLALQNKSLGLVVVIALSLWMLSSLEMKAATTSKLN
jgi:hypothetical protein